MGQQTELLAREIAASPGELRPGHVPARLQTGLEKLDGGEHEKVSTLVVSASAGADPSHDVFGKLKIVH
jgi:hypothetical protein